MSSAYITIIATTVINVLFLRAGGWSEQWGLAPAARWLCAVAFSSMMLVIVLQQVFAHRARQSRFRHLSRPPTTPEAYQTCGVLPPEVSAVPAKLYLDLVRRSVANLIYEDRPAWLITATGEYKVVDSFDLEARIVGRDQPTEALSIVGWKRLEQLQNCIEQVLLDGVPGDLMELGVLRGGAAVLMRATLKAHGCLDRRVFACDTFEFIPPAMATANSFWLATLSRLVSAIPGERWRRHLTKTVFHSFQKSFPATQDPCDELVQITMWFMQHPETVHQLSETSVEHVRSHFARFGLWDEQVVLLKGFFADTIPTAPIQQLAVVRLDADTYESTRDALNLTYAKLSPGGYCIIDDYGYFSECRRAVDEFRAAHEIQETIETIDDFGVYWRKQT